MMVMAKRSPKKGFWDATSQAPAAVSLVLGFVLVVPGILFPSVVGSGYQILGTLMELAGFVFILAGIVTIYLLGGANRKQSK